jgi:UDP-N-acetylmuramate dehydrogenase
MMARRRADWSLLERMPAVRGRLQAGAPLAPLTWFRVGGPAEILFMPADEKDLSDFLAALPAEISVSVIGAGSNLLIRDGGVNGVVVLLGAGFGDIQIMDDGMITAGAAVMDVKLSSAARDASLTGLEFLRGVPGTLGGAVRMNAGAYGGEIRDVFVSARCVDRRGAAHEVSLQRAGFSYRHSDLPPDFIVTSVRLRGRPGDPRAISARMAEIAGARSASQPVGARTSGSTFANPDDPRAQGRKAWELIDAAGCRGMRLGGAMVSKMHCNFLVNGGDATARDLEALGERVRARVLQQTGIALQWEIRRMGEVEEAP